MAPQLNIKINRTDLWLVIIILLGAALRLFHPTFRSLWGDEVDSLFRTYNLSAHNFHYEPIGLSERIGLALTNPLKGHHLPAFYLLLSFWTAFFGVGELALRSLSVVLGILCIPMTYWLAKEFYDENTARLSAFLMAISSFAVLYSQEIRPYSLMMLASAASTYFFWRLISQKKRPADWLGYVGAGLVLVFSHLFGVLAISAQSLYLLIARLRERSNRGTLGLIALGQVLIYFLAAPVIFPIITSGAKVMAGIGQDFPFTQIPPILKLFLNFFALGFGETLAPWHWSVVVPAGLVYLVLFASIFIKWKEQNTLCLLILLFWPIVIGSFLVKLTLPKYLIIVLPIFIVLIARAIVGIRALYVRTAVLILVILAQLVSLGNYYRVEEYHNANQMEPWRQVCATIEAQFEPNDVILVNSYDISFRLVQYYLNIKSGNYPVRLVNYPGSEGLNIEADGNSPLYISPTELFDRKPARIWLVNHLRDERKTPPDEITKLKYALLRRYKLALQVKYIPYETTLIAKLPFFKPKQGEYRIVVERYDKIWLHNDK